jgi:hypothetical protein
MIDTTESGWPELTLAGYERARELVTDLMTRTTGDPAVAFCAIGMAMARAAALYGAPGQEPKLVDMVATTAKGQLVVDQRTSGKPS